MTTNSGSNFLKVFRLYDEEKEEETTNWQKDGESTLYNAAEESELEVEYHDLCAVVWGTSGASAQLEGSPTGGEAVTS